MRRGLPEPQATFDSIKRDRRKTGSSSTRAVSPIWQKYRQIVAGAQGDDAALMAFWNMLRPGFEHFQRTKELPVITVDARGSYVVRGR